MLLNDPILLARIEEGIDRGKTAAGAIEAAIDEFEGRLRGVRDPYIQERVEDLEDLCSRILGHLIVSILPSPLLAQVVGYTGPVSAEQLERNAAASYLPNDVIGIAGVEATYETQLRGQPGAERVERDQAGRTLQIVEATPATPGASLRLTIDSREQQIAQQALQWGIHAAGLKRGVVIVMNPQTGEAAAGPSGESADGRAIRGAGDRQQTGRADQCAAAVGGRA